MLTCYSIVCILVILDMRKQKLSVVHYFMLGMLKLPVATQRNGHPSSLKTGM